MIKIDELTTADPRYGWVENLMHVSFPVDERRDPEAQRANVDHEPKFHCCMASDAGSPVGLFCYWDFGSFCYCEHFAIDPELRNHGYGGRVLDALIAEIGRPMVLEVELPDSEMARRRIGFYRRHGLELWDRVCYVQPPYRCGGNELPMMIMATGGLDPDRDMPMVRDSLYRHVYAVGRNSGADAE